MKKKLYVLILPLVVAGGLVFANREFKNETQLSQKPVAVAPAKSCTDEKKKWEASPDGVKYKAWEASPEGKKVHASHDKIRKQIDAFADMEAVVISDTFQREGAEHGPKWLIVSIDGDYYMMQFIPDEWEQLSSLEVGDKITVKSRSAGYSNNHPYLILSGDYIEHNGKVLFKRDFSKNKGC
ncbi:hypothetical protein OGH69_11260 [Flavobacterium sp. MFBS3-15]|uniref:hypothetical protein n=1 Tax=Flavobacterium sp. MFBS3-15 TaxID=2989816 RepID=UPI00223619A3|nr:hypothetical protein [Flavobacterium sp. MFBS3-15]MCW4469546.1 hypothetical protein [Flavobacterium sp. MFBS3-15]